MLKLSDHKQVYHLLSFTKVFLLFDVDYKEQLAATKADCFQVLYKLFYYIFCCYEK